MVLTVAGRAIAMTKSCMVCYRPFSAIARLRDGQTVSRRAIFGPSVATVASGSKPAKGTSEPST